MTLNQQNIFKLGQNHSYMAFKFVRNEIERTIEEIVDVEGKTSLGTASGMDIAQCFSTASRLCEATNDFLNDVNYYRICDKRESIDPRCAITIEFYK